jgi:hypothetical protein
MLREDLYIHINYCMPCIELIRSSIFLLAQEIIKFILIWDWHSKFENFLFGSSMLIVFEF